MLVTLAVGLALPKSAPAQVSLRYGTWKLIPAKSSYKPGPSPKSETRTYKANGDALAHTLDRIEADGSHTAIHWAAHFDGKDNPYVGTPIDDTIALTAVDDLTLNERIELGQRLFGDRRLSRDGTIACASCHDPGRAFADGRVTPVGAFGRTGRRNAPALINWGYGRAFFWDARIATLEEQVLKPIEDPNEMDLPVEEAAGRVGLDRAISSPSSVSFTSIMVNTPTPAVFRARESRRPRNS